MPLPNYDAWKTASPPYCEPGPDEDESDEGWTLDDYKADEADRRYSDGERR